MISESSTGIYIAYPRAEEFKIAHAGPGTLVNSHHTKVGIAKDSFHASAARYRKTFDSQVKFIPLVEIPTRNLPLIEKEIISAVARRYPRVGAAQNWFDTQDRESIISLVYALMSSNATRPTDDQGVSIEKAG